jgi:hypothetical protein
VEKAKLKPKNLTPMIGELNQVYEVIKVQLSITYHFTSFSKLSFSV